MRKLTLIFVIWTACQLPKAIFTLARLKTTPEDDPFDQQDDLKTALIMFIFQVITDVFPLVLSLEGNFLQIFTVQFKVQEPERPTSEEHPDNGI